MEREGGLVQLVNPQTLPKWLLIAAVVLSVLGFAVGWFSVDTEVRTWRYDATDTSNTDGDPKGAGDPAAVKVTVDTEMKFLSLDADVNPNDVQDLLEASTDAFPPTYDAHFGKTGTAMLGVFLLHTVTTAVLVCLLLAYLRQLRGTRELAPSVHRLTGLYLVLAIVTGASLAFQVPAAAEGDVQDVLVEYSSVLEAAGLPAATESVFRPEVRFWYTWICCPPDSNFPLNGQQYLLVATTTSRPAAGFWFEVMAVASAGGALIMAHRAGHFDPKVPLPARAPMPTAAPPPPLTKS